jgi:hypothetical protein
VKYGFDMKMYIDLPGNPKVLAVVDGKSIIDIPAGCLLYSDTDDAKKWQIDIDVNLDDLYEDSLE